MAQTAREYALHVGDLGLIPSNAKSPKHHRKYPVNTVLKVDFKRYVCFTYVMYVSHSKRTDSV